MRLTAQPKSSKQQDLLFLPFFEDLIDYDCAECGSRCCESGIITATVREAKILIKEFPFMNYFLLGKKKDRSEFNKYPRCWFLEPSGICEIQRKYGYSNKPFICRLHPFYVAKCGEVYVVTPIGCYRLRAKNKDERRFFSSTALLGNAIEAIKCDFISEDLGWSHDKLEMERTILSESRKYLSASNYIDFAAVQIGAATGNEKIPEIRAELRDAVELWVEFLGLKDFSQGNATLTYEMTVLTSLLRATSLPLRTMEGNRIPVALMALYLYVNIFSRSKDVERYLTTYQYILADIPVGLTYLKREDLKIKPLSLEKKLNYIRTLRLLHAKNYEKKPNSTTPPKS